MNIKYASWTRSEVERALDQAVSRRDAAIARADALQVALNALVLAVDAFTYCEGSWKRVQKTLAVAKGEK